MLYSKLMARLTFERDIVTLDYSVYIKGKYQDIYLGCIYFYPKWNTYVFEPEQDLVFSWDCLHEIQIKLIELNRSRKI